MVRLAVTVHTLLLAAGCGALLGAPLPLLAAFGVADPALPVLALTRVFAGALAVVAAAVAPLPALPAQARRGALAGVAVAYGAAAGLAGVQQVAIWSRPAGAALVAALAALAFAFAALAVAERSPRAALA